MTTSLQGRHDHADCIKIVCTSCLSGSKATQIYTTEDYPESGRDIPVRKLKSPACRKHAKGGRIR